MAEPILVVGGGPVGLTAALMIARHGVPVRIVDASDGPTDLSKALVVWRRTLETLDAEIPYEDFAAAHGELLGARIDLDERVEEIPIAEDGDGPRVPAGLFVPQSDTERILLAALARRGVRVERRTRLTGFAPAATGVTCALEGPGGEVRLETPWLVGADGAHSTVRHKLGVGFRGESVDRAWLLADVDVEAEPVPDPHRIHIVAAEAGMVVLFPLGGRRSRVIADLGAPEPGAPRREPTAQDVQRLLNERTVLGWRVTETHWLSDFRVNERQVERYVHGRVLLAGDAAHVHSPAGGQGMNTGMQDAANLAWKVALAARGAVHESLVETYQAERHPVGHRVVELTSRLLQAGMAHGALTRRLRDALAPLALSLGPVQRRLRGFLTEDDVTYRDGPLADGTGSGRDGARSGDAFPDVVVAGPGGRRSAHTLLRGAEATLVLMGEAAAEAPALRFGAGGGPPVAVRRIGAGRDAEDPDGRLAAVLGGGAALVRPDGVIATITDGAAGAADWIRERLPAP